MVHRWLIISLQSDCGNAQSYSRNMNKCVYFFASVGAKVSDFSIVDSQGNHLGFDDIVLMMPESIDESQSRLYDTEESEG